MGVTALFPFFPGNSWALEYKATLSEVVVPILMPQFASDLLSRAVDSYGHRMMEFVKDLQELGQ